MLADCYLYTQDEALARQICAYLASIAKVTVIDQARRLDRIKPPGIANLVLVDLVGADALELVGRLRLEYPDTLIIALGTPRSDPLLFAETQGVYATENRDLERKHFQSLIKRALEHLHLREENQLLKEEVAKTPSVLHLAKTLSILQRPEATHILRHFSRALRQLQNETTLMESVVEGVANAMAVARVGLFSFSRDTGRFRLSAGLKCLEGTEQLEYPETDGLVAYLESNTHLISAPALANISERESRLMLRRNLEVLGAEVIIPLQVKSRVTGWLFLGQRVNGAPFETQDLEDLSVIGDLVSSLLDNAVLHEELAIQKNLFEALFHSIPLGIVAVCQEQIVRCINHTALQLLHRKHDAVINQSVDLLGGLGDILQGALNGEVPQPPIQWTEPVAKRELTVYAQRLEQANSCLGVFALLKGRTDFPLGEPAPTQLESKTPPALLGPDIAHEIKDHLVAMSTFVQLLPERSGDLEFCGHFCEIIGTEIDRIKDLLKDESDEAASAHH